MGRFPKASLGSFSGQRLPCILGVRLRMSSWLWLGSVFSVVAFVCFQVFPLPPLPIQERRGLSPIVFPLNSLFSVTGACFGSLGWWAGLMAWVVGWEGLWGVPPTWVWVVGFSPQILEHPTSICDTGVNNLFAFQGVLIFLTHRLL